MIKKTAESMVDGMFMGAALLKALFEQVVALGGHPEMIHYLTTEHGKETVKKLAEVIVASEWRVPASLMCKMAYQFSHVEEGNDHNLATRDSVNWWGCVLDRFPHIPATEYKQPGCQELEPHPDLPQEVVDQLVGLKIDELKPIVVTMDGEKYVVVAESTSRGEVGSVLFNDVREIDTVTLSPAKCFQLDR